MPADSGFFYIYNYVSAKFTDYLDVSSNNKTKIFKMFFYFRLSANLFNYVVFINIYQC